MDEPMRAPEMPVFVKIEDYKDVIDIMELIKSKVNEANKILDNIRQLKSQEDAELEQWSANIEEVERKVAYVDKTLFEPQNVR
ncbi:MAG: hypothetical protein ACLFPQ_01705 [Candidatus Woesearchaeota archaeon]